MEVRVDSKKISGLLRLKGEERLMVRDEVTAGIHATISKISGKLPIRLAFLNSVKRETWVEYGLLLEIPKAEEHIKYLSYEFEEIGKFLKILEDTLDYENTKIDSVGIEEVETGLPNYYYILIYMLKDGE